MSRQRRSCAVDRHREKGKTKNSGLKTETKKQKHRKTENFPQCGIIIALGMSLKGRGGSHLAKTWGDYNKFQR